METSYKHLFQGGNTSSWKCRLFMLLHKITRTTEANGLLVDSSSSEQSMVFFQTNSDDKGCL